MNRYISNYKFYWCKLLFKAGLLKYFNFTFSKKINNTHYRIPVINCAGFTNLAPDYEPWFNKFLTRILVSDQPVIVDVGVNIGQTILKVSSLNKKISYYGFEPNPVCYAYSRKLVQANNLINYKIYPVGLAEKFQVLPLYGDNDYAAGASVIQNFRKNTKRYKSLHYVVVAEGDAVLDKENLSAIDFIKVDVEGYELEVMRGFEKTIEKFKPLIMLEILPVYSLDDANGQLRKTRQDQLLKLMDDYGYQVCLINEDTATLQMINDIPVHGDMKRTNYLFIPLNKVQDFLPLIASREADL